MTCASREAGAPGAACGSRARGRLRDRRRRVIADARALSVRLEVGRRVATSRATHLIHPFATRARPATEVPGALVLINH